MYQGLNSANVGRKTPHGVILEIPATNICGWDQHTVRGRTSAPSGLVLGHEISGEVVVTGPDVEFVKVGDVCSALFKPTRYPRRPRVAGSSWVAERPCEERESAGSAR